jgi:hypothetical protein
MKQYEVHFTKTVNSIERFKAVIEVDDDAEEQEIYQAAYMWEGMTDATERESTYDPESKEELTIESFKEIGGGQKSDLLYVKSDWVFAKNVDYDMSAEEVEKRLRELDAHLD